MAGRLCFVLGLLVMILVFSEITDGAMSRPRPTRRKKKEETVAPIVPPDLNIDINQMLGKWYLLNVASKCPYLKEPGNKVEATTMTLQRPTTGAEQKLSVITTTRHNHQCWEIHQEYDLTPNSGYFIIKGENPQLNTKVTVMDTDYTSYAILVYEKRKKITMKLYARSVATLHEPMLKKFDDAAAQKNIGMAFLFPPHITSHCDEVDEDHVINCIPTC